MSKLLGITGTIGSGKSTIGEILKAHGVAVIDTDAIVHNLLANSASIKSEILERFGTLERKQLGTLLFSNKQAKQDLEAILHPAVILECRKAAKELADQKIIAFLVPLLFEANLEGEYDQIWSVTVEEKVLRDRLKKRNNFTDAEIDARLSNQLSQQAKSAKAHYTIDNSGTIQETQHQVEKLLEPLLTHP